LGKRLNFEELYGLSSSVKTDWLDPDSARPRSRPSSRKALVVRDRDDPVVTVGVVAPKKS
jgi:hypothetical protein